MPTRTKLARQLAILALPLAIAALLLGATAARAAPPSQSAQEGETIFQQRCASCHTIGGGTLVGPDLAGATERRPRDFLIGYIVNPTELRAQGDPTAAELAAEFGGIMPNLGVTETEAESILAYVEAQAGGAPAGPTEPTPAPGATPPAAPAEPQPPAVAGDQTIGHALFTGQANFANGGTPCIACHDVAGVAGLGGGTLGPDLTQAFQRYGAAGLASVLATIPFPTMMPVYANAPLTPEEQQNLAAYLASTANAQPAPAFPTILVLVLVLFLAVLALFHFIWRRRSGLVRQPMVAKQRERRRAA